MSMKVTKEEFLGVKHFNQWAEACDLQFEEDVCQYLLEKHPELIDDMFKVIYLGKWKDDDGRE